LRDRDESIVKTSFAAYQSESKMMYGFIVGCPPPTAYHENKVNTYYKQWARDETTLTDRETVRETESYINRLRGG